MYNSDDIRMMRLCCNFIHVVNARVNLNVDVRKVVKNTRVT